MYYSLLVTQGSSQSLDESVPRCLLALSTADPGPVKSSNITACGHLDSGLYPETSFILWLKCFLGDTEAGLSTRDSEKFSYTHILVEQSQECELCWSPCLGPDLDTTSLLSLKDSFFHFSSQIIKTSPRFIFIKYSTSSP